MDLARGVAAGFVRSGERVTRAARAPLAFVRHPWPFPSAFSLLGCVARVNLLSRRQLAALFTTAGARLQKVAETLGTLHDARDLGVDPQIVEARLGLTPAELRLAFDSSAWWPEAFRSLREALSGPTRFCPECIQQGYHTHLFDLPWVARCPVHMQPLVNACPRCGGGIYGLSQSSISQNAFSCLKCHADFSNTGAIIMASRASGARLQESVAAHFRWCRRISDAYVVAPTSPGRDVESDAAFLHALINITGIEWPSELGSIVDPAGLESGGIHVSVSAFARKAVERLRRLSRNVGSASIDNVEAFSCSLEQSRWLLNIERRLQTSAGEREARAIRDYYYYARRWLKAGGLSHRERTALPQPNHEVGNSGPRPAPSSIRGHGYRYRARTISIETTYTGNTYLSVVQGDLSELSSVRLLAGIAAVKRSLPVRELKVVRAIIDWWYQHLLALSLVDTMSAAAHKAGWLTPESCPSPEVLPGWPLVDLDRIPPGRAWMLAATRVGGALTAHLIPVALRRQRNGEFPRLRDLTYDLARTAAATAWIRAKAPK